MESEFTVVIPARYESTRFPGKVLADLNGRPMLQHVYDKAVESGADTVIVATDDDRIANVAENFGAKVCMTSSEHTSGTERIAEVAEACEFDENDIIINVQADEPLLPPKVIRDLAADMEEFTNIKVGSVCSELTNVEQLFDPNIVKVVLNRRSIAMYFSRAPIPWNRDEFSKDRTNIKLPERTYYRHHGLYAFRAGFLANFADWQESPIEDIEKLEQLRILWHCGRMHMHVTNKAMPLDVNTPQDLEVLQKAVGSASSSS